ncbi:MAG: hypothetical protein QOJ09_2023, partial [Actinomycetota bacterium]|nr:hypothetical protein [Actinomycetota bacterium]
MGDARVDKRADGAPPAPAPAPARDPATNGNVHPGAALDRADGQGGADVIDHVQRTAGNQAATALVAQRAVHGGRGVEGVVDDLQLAMRMTVEGGGFVYTKVDVEAVASALTGLTAAEAAAVRALYEKRTELNLIDVLRGHGGLAAWGLSPEQRARLLALAQGTSAALDTAAMQQGPLAAATAVIGYAAEAMTAEARGVEADAIVVHDALQELEKRKMAEMFVGKAQATEGKGWETLLQTLSKAPDHNGRVAVVYEERYDTNLLTKFHEVFSGVGLDRVLAVYRGDRAAAASAAVLQSLDKAEGMRAGLENPMAKVASMTSPGGKEDYEAAARRQREVEGAIEANMAELVQADPAAAKRLLARKDVAEKMQAWVRPETTAVVAELVESDDVAVAAARLVRSEREHTITGADIEQSLMSLRQLAFNEVHTWFVTTASHLRASLSDAQLEAAVKALARQRGEVFAGVLRKVFARFEKRFDSASERPLAKVLGSVGSEADRDRSRWLWVGGGQIGDEVHTFFGRTWTVSADVRTVDLAIRSKDIERIRQVLEPKGPKQMDDLTKRYKDELDRDLHADLLGPPELRAYAQAMSIWLKPAEREKADEQRALVKGVGFEPTTEDPLGLVREEASWTYNRLTVLHDRVMGNRGTFARLHDWVGNLEHDLVERALDDGTEAYNLALAATGIFGMANLAMAQQHLGTLRRARARLEHNLDVYKTATAEAFNAFVDFAVMAVVTIVTFGEGTAVAMAFRGIAGTIGTKLVLKGDDYSLTEFKNDLLGGAGGAMFGALGSKAFEVLGPRIAGLASEAGLVLPRELATIAKKGAGFVVDTEASTLGTSAFTGDAHFASADDFKMGVVTKAAHTAMGVAKPNASAHGEQPPETTTRPPGGGGEGESATRPPGGGGGEGESAPRRPEPEGSQADHATDTVSGGGGTAPPEAAPAPRSERRLPNAAHPEEVRTFLREAAAAGDHEAILRLWYERGTWAEGTRWLAKAAGPESAHLQSARQLIFDEALAHVRSRLPDVEASLPGSVGAGSDMDPTFMGPHTLEAVRLFREGFE